MTKPTLSDVATLLDDHAYLEETHDDTACHLRSEWCAYAAAVREAIAVLERCEKAIKTLDCIDAVLTEDCERCGTLASIRRLLGEKNE